MQRLNIRHIPRRHLAAALLIGMIAAAFTISWIRHEPVVYAKTEQPHLSALPTGAAGRIRGGVDNELLTFQDKGWTYAYYRRPHGSYEVVQIEVTDSDTHYTVQTTVEPASDEAWIDTECLIRFRAEPAKEIRIAETEVYGES